MRIHILMQGKGGVGKSFISVIYSQYLKATGKSMFGIDTDPVNDTYHQFHGLEVVSCNICNRDGEIESENFDKILDYIEEHNDCSDVVIDNGSSDFIPLINYIKSTKVFELLNDLDHQIVVHSIISGGQAYYDTCTSLNVLLQSLDTDTFKTIVWLNPINGKLTFDDFKTSKVYNENLDRKIWQVIQLPSFSDMFNKDIQQMMSERKLFDEFINNKENHIMKRQRIIQAKKKFFEAISIATQGV
jgi:hypothetical protein